MLLSLSEKDLIDHDFKIDTGNITMVEVICISKKSTVKVNIIHFLNKPFTVATLI